MVDSGTGSESSNSLRKRVGGWLRDARVRSDEGVGQAIEAMVIGALVMGAIGFALASQAPPPPSQTGGSEDLEQKTWDAIQALDDMYYPDEAYSNSMLSYLLAEAAAGNSTPLAESLDEFMPPGSDFQVYLHNGYDRIELHVNKTQQGQTASVSYPVEPGWQHHYGRSDLRLYNSNVSHIAMGHNMIPIFNSNHVHDQGKLVQASVAGHQEWAPGFKDAGEIEGLGAIGDLASGVTTGFEETSYTSYIQGDAEQTGTDDGYPSASIYMQCDREHAGEPAPCYAVDFTGQSTGYGPKQLDADENGGLNSAKVGFVVENNGPGALGEDTVLEIELPVGLPINDTITEDQAVQNVNGFDSIRVEGNQPQPQTIHAALSEPLDPGDKAVLDAWLHTTDDRYAFKNIHATLAEDAASSSQFLAVVEDKQDSTYTGGDTRVTLVSAPRPAGSGDAPEGRWAIVMPNPYGQSTIDEARLALTESKGYFESASFPEDFNPQHPASPVTQNADVSVSQDGTTVTWNKTGGHDVGAYSFIELQFIVDGDGTLEEPIPASPSFPVAQPDSEFLGYHPPPHAIQIEPGIWWQEHPPNDDNRDLPGYGANAEDPTQENPLRSSEALNHIHHRNTDIDGETTYRLADFGLTTQESQSGLLEGALKDAAHSASMEPAPQRAAPGEDVHLTISSQDLALFLSEHAGVNALNMETQVYAPWGIPDLIPIETYDHALSAALFHDPVEMMPARLTGPGQDLVVASNDGNLYGLEGDSGSTITGMTFPLPEAQQGESAQPTVLTRASNGQQIYGVGTSSGLNHWYSLDEDLDQRWSADKPEGFVKTHALNTSLDLTGDGIPEFVAATGVASLDEEANPHGQSRLVLYDGATGAIMDGWSNATSEGGDGVQIPGVPNNVGFANLGVDADGGVWSGTGFTVGTNLDENLNMENETVETMPEQALEAVFEFTAGLSDSGLQAYDANGTLAWEFKGGAFKDIERAEAMSLGHSEDGDPYHGIVGAGGNGWMYGLNSSKALPMVDGWTTLGFSSYDDVSMSNPLEGYWIGGDDPQRVYATRDGGTTSTWTRDVGPLNAIDTPDAPAFSGPGSVSWMAGDAGNLHRSPDRLTTIESLSGVAALLGSLSLEDGLTGLLEDDSLDLTNVNFQDVHAVSEDEAWFVGTGVNTTALEEQGYIVHTVDGGDSFEAYEIPCEDTSASCGLNSIDADDDRLWTAGKAGLVLTEDISAQAARVDATGTTGLHDNGVLGIDLDVDGTAPVRNVTVDFTFDQSLEDDWMRGAYVEDSVGTRDLWNRTGGGDHIGDASNHNSDKGAMATSNLHADSYTEDIVGDADVADLEDATRLMIGPFHSTTLILSEGTYYDGPDYEDEGFLPMEFSVRITYEDGSRNLFEVTVHEDRSATVEDQTPVVWETPGDVGYEVPNTCFGDATAGCADYTSINATHGHPDGPTVALAGTPLVNGAATQAPLTRLAPGSSTFERIWDERINQTLLDVAISPQDPDNWIVVGDGPLVAQSQDAGKNWTVLPTLIQHGEGEGDGQPLRAVDHTDPRVPMLVGGQGSGLQWFAGGHHEHGEIETQDLWTQPDPVDRVNFTDTKLLISQSSGGHTPVEIQIQDPASPQSEDGWVTVFDPADGWVNDTRENAGPLGGLVDDTMTGWGPHYNYSQPTDEIKLRFDLSATPGFTPTSAQLRGQLEINGTPEGTDDEIQLVLDLNETSGFDEASKVNLEHDTDNGLLRMQSVQNPWVWRLGNYQEGPWTAHDHPENGAEPTSMGLTPDGHNVFVGTGPIHTGFEGPTTEPIAYDNTLYKINVTTGLPDPAWDNIRFDDPIHHVEVGTEHVYVATAPWSDLLQDATVHRITHDGTQTGTVDADGDLDKLRLVAYQAAFEDQPASASDDLAMIVVPQNLDDGRVIAYEAPSMKEAWWDNPSVEGRFEVTYPVPRNALYGAYVVVTEIDWTITDTYGNELVQTSRIHNSFDVTPPTKEISLSPTYNLEVVAWMEDW